MPTQWWEFAPSDRLRISSSSSLANSRPHANHTRGNGGNSVIHFTPPHTGANNSGATTTIPSPSLTRSRSYHNHIAHSLIGENYHVKTSLPLNPQDGLVYMEVQIVGINEHTLTSLLAQDEHYYSSDSELSKTILEPLLVIGVTRELLPTHSLPGQDATSVGLYTKQKMIFSNSHKTVERVAVTLQGIPPLLSELLLSQQLSSSSQISSSSSSSSYISSSSTAPSPPLPPSHKLKEANNHNKEQNQTRQVNISSVLPSGYSVTRGNSSPTNGLGAIRSSLRHQRHAVGNNNSNNNVFNINRSQENEHWSELTRPRNVTHNNKTKNNTNATNNSSNNNNNNVRRKLTVGDALGCLVDFFDHTLHFTVNGKLLSYSRKLDDKLPLNGYYMAVGMQTNCPSMTFRVIFRTGNQTLSSVKHAFFTMPLLPNVKCLSAVDEKHESVLEANKLQSNRSAEENINYKRKNTDNDVGTDNMIVFDLNSYIHAIAMKMIRKSIHIQEQAKATQQNAFNYINDNNNMEIKNRVSRKESEQLQMSNQNHSTKRTEEIVKYNMNFTELREMFLMNEAEIRHLTESGTENLEYAAMETAGRGVSHNDSAMVSLLAQFMSARGMTRTLNVLKEEIHELQHGRSSQKHAMQNVKYNNYINDNNNNNNNNNNSNNNNSGNKVNAEANKNVALDSALRHSETINYARRTIFKHTPVTGSRQPISHSLKTAYFIENKHNKSENTMLTMWLSKSFLAPVIWESLLHLILPTCTKGNEVEEHQDENTEMMQRIIHFSSLLFLVRRQDILFLLQSLHLMETCCEALFTQLRSLYQLSYNTHEEQEKEANNKSDSAIGNMKRNAQLLHTFSTELLEPFRVLLAIRELLNTQHEAFATCPFSQESMLQEMCCIVEHMCESTYEYNNNVSTSSGSNTINQMFGSCSAAKLLPAAEKLRFVMEVLTTREAKEQLIELSQQAEKLVISNNTHLEQLQQEHEEEEEHDDTPNEQIKQTHVNAGTMIKHDGSKKSKKKVVVKHAIRNHKENNNDNQSNTKYVKHNQKEEEEQRMLNKMYLQDMIDEAIAVIVAESVPVVNASSMSEQLYIVQTFHTFCTRVEAFVKCLATDMSTTDTNNNNNNDNSSFVKQSRILYWSEKWIELIESALMQYRSKVWVLLRKAIEDANESASQLMLNCLSERLQHVTQQITHCHNEHSSDKMKMSDAANHTKTITNNEKNQSITHVQKEVRIIHELLCALLQCTNGFSLRSIWRTCHVKSILEPAQRMPTNAFINEMSAVLNELPAFFVANTHNTKEVIDTESLQKHSKVKVNNDVTPTTTTKKHTFTSSSLKRPSTPPIGVQYRKFEQPEEEVRQQQQHVEQCDNGNNVNDTRAIVTTTTTTTRKEVEEIVEEEKEQWYMDEFRLGAVYLHRIYKHLFH